jgi:steroid delta-isomerase-like uncharacterized protein
MTNNSEIVRAWSDLYNSREWDKWLSMVSPDIEFIDLAQGVTAKGRDEMLAYGKGWSDAFSDAAYQEHRLRDCDGVVVFQFVGAGLNDGAFGPFPATGKRAAFPVTNVVELDGEGRIARVEQLYDRLSILTQLGHIQLPEG